MPSAMKSQLHIFVFRFRYDDTATCEKAHSPCHSPFLLQEKAAEKMNPWNFSHLLRWSLLFSASSHEMLFFFSFFSASFFCSCFRVFFYSGKTKPASSEDLITNVRRRQRAESSSYNSSGRDPFFASEAKLCETGKRGKVGTGLLL